MMLATTGNRTSVKTMAASAFGDLVGALAKGKTETDRVSTVCRRAATHSHHVLWHHTTLSLSFTDGPAPSWALCQPCLHLKRAKVAGDSVKQRDKTRQPNPTTHTKPQTATHTLLSHRAKRSIGIHPKGPCGFYVTTVLVIHVSPGVVVK